MTKDLLEMCGPRNRLKEYMESYLLTKRLI
jgi:hypothetical protein